LLEQSIASHAPDNSPGLSTQIIGDEKGQPVRFYAYSDAVSELIFSAESRDVAFAVLRGNFGVDEDGGFVEVTGFSEFADLDADEDPYPVVRRACDAVILTEAGITRPGDAMMQTEPMVEAGALVGLFIVDRGHDAQLDTSMAYLHYSLFNVPFQIILVFDPNSRNMAMYARPPRGRFANVAFRWITPVDHHA